MARVTVLVAAYNAEAFLPVCLDSLKAQTLTDVQVVCVDDGSTDGTLALLQDYARRDERFCALHLTENHGQAYARNQALRRAEGDYVCFLDADDWMAADALQQAVATFEAHDDTDCVLFDVAYVYHDHTDIYQMPDFEQIGGEEAFRMSLDWTIHGVYMVRTELHRRFPYDDSCKSYSDDNTTRMHYLAARAVRRCHGTYYYLQHAQSATHQVSVRRYDFLRANESMKQMLRQQRVAEPLMRQWETMRLLVLVDVYMFHFGHAHELPYGDAAYGLEEMHRVWRSLERRLIDKHVRRKFGYRLMPAWWLFRLQEQIYFTLRGWRGKNV